MMEARANRPDSANGLRKVLREMMKVAVKLEWREDDPTQGVKKIKPKKLGGFHRWTDSEIAKFEEAIPWAAGRAWRWRWASTPGRRGRT